MTLHPLWHIVISLLVVMIMGYVFGVFVPQPWSFVFSFVFGFAVGSFWTGHYVVKWLFD